MVSRIFKTNNNIKKLIVVSLMSFMGVALVYACGSEEDDQYSDSLLEISLSCPDFEDARLLSRTLGDERHQSEIVTLILTVDQGQPPMNPISEEFDPDDDEFMVNVPIGTDRRFRIQGVDEDGNVVCEGETITDVNPDDMDSDIVVDIPCEFLIEDCTDGIDNNFDGLIDCEDPDCVDFCMEPGDDDDDNPPPGNDDDDTPTEPEICDDGIDNNGNGAVDCNDIDCIRAPICLFPPPPPPQGCTPQDCENEVEECECFCCVQCCYETPGKAPTFCSDPEQN